MANLKKIDLFSSPKILPASIRVLDWFIKDILAVKYMYGKRVKEKTKIAPKIFLTLGKKVKSSFKLKNNLISSFADP
tara:strand:- start:14 stop:244 length:231 start_codon:yes stop_codon:yes gene_type:complete